MREVAGRHLRKVALAADGKKIEVWGDGEQTRSYCYVSDCVEDMYRLLHSDHHDPINLGQDRMVTINELVDMVARIAGKTIKKRLDFSKPQGVRGRNADISLMRSVLGWEPQVRLEDGLTHTYAWIERQLAEGARHPAADEAKGSGPIVTMTGRHGIERAAGPGAVPPCRGQTFAPVSRRSRPCHPGPGCLDGRCCAQVTAFGSEAIRHDGELPRSPPVCFGREGA